MYNGIGLQTARGSGTSGHIQKNQSISTFKLQNKDDFLKELEEKRRNNLPPPRKANQQIVEHQRKRQILIRTMQLKQKLSKEGYSQHEIQEKVKQAEQILKKRMQSGQMQTKNKDTHVLTAEKQKQYMKLSKAMGLKERDQIGSAFDFSSQREDKLKRQYERSQRKSYPCPFEKCGKNYSQPQLLERHLKYKHPQPKQSIQGKIEDDSRTYSNQKNPQKTKTKNEQQKN